jgi:hypothetical protein
MCVHQYFNPTSARNRNRGRTRLSGSATTWTAPTGISQGFTKPAGACFPISWRIYGEEYILLEDKSVVRDVLKVPKHSKDSLQFIGSCQSNGHDVPGTAIAVLKNENGIEMLPAVVAWKIDEKQMKFVQLQPERLRCPRNGTTTADGGF